MNSALLKARRRREIRFMWYCRLALGSAALFLVMLLGSLAFNGASGFFISEARIEVNLTPPAPPISDPALPAPLVAPATPQPLNHNGLVQDALRSKFPDAVTRADLKGLFGLISSDAGYILRDQLADNAAPASGSVTIWVPLSDKADMFMKGKITKDMPAHLRRLSDKQVDWLEALQKEGNVRTRFNSGFFSSGDSLKPERAGFWGSMAGSLLAMIVCLGLVFPLGVMTAIYLEEFAPQNNKLVDIIEVNINNLAAIPSIVFGLLGLAIYISLMGMPRSSALVGGLTLALMVLPVIIITTRVALKSVPGTIRAAARALGASPLQVVVHHVFPLALPGIMTGTILGMARAIGETAPLLMIGMVAFVADIPGTFTDPATAMPVQVYLWANNPEMGFAEKASAGILVLLLVLVILNSLAIYIRKRFEKRW